MLQIILAISTNLITEQNDFLPFLQHQFDICDIIHDTETLFSTLHFRKPDIVLLDLQLTGLSQVDGLYRLREQYPHTELIVISENQSFSEVFAALQCQAADFLCKPFDSYTLSSCIFRVQNRMREKKGLDTVFDTRCFIGKLFIEYAKKVSPDKQMDETSINNLYRTFFMPDTYRILTVGLEATEALQIENKQDITETCAKQLFLHLENSCHEILFDIDYLRIHVLLNYRQSCDSEIRESLEICQKDFAATLPQGILAVFCCSKVHSHITEIQEMLDEAVNAMWTRFRYGKSIVLYAETEPPCSKLLHQIYENTERQLKTACSTLDLESFQQTLADFFSRPDYIVGRYETRELLRHVEYYMLDINRNLIASFTDINCASHDIKLSLRTANTLKDYKDQYTAQLISLFQKILEYHGSQSQPIRKAKHYIQKNYASPVSLTATANYVGLTPAYLSARFKEEMGIGFTDYLNLYRINISKKLLAETNEKILIIAQMTGYTSSKYYSRIFKELVGIRPNEYRISNQRNQKENDAAT